MRYYRQKSQDCIYHITCRCNNQEMLFTEEIAFKKYLDILDRCKKKHIFDIYNYVIMQNHVHLIIHPGPMSDISQIMHSVNRWYARWYNIHYERKGHFWEARFDSVQIKDDLQVLATMRYIDINPVKGQLAGRPTDWQYSGARFYINGCKNGLITAPKTYTELGETEEARRTAYSSIIGIDLIRLE